MDDKAPRSDHGGAPGIRMRIGCRLKYRLTQPTPLIAMLNVHYSRFGDLERADYLVTSPSVPLESYRDGFGNWCTRMVAPAGDFALSTDGIFRDCGLPDPVAPDATQAAVQDLPFETLVYLLGSRYCDTDLLSEEAWRLFENTPTGWARVQAICDFVHSAVSFDYMEASATRTASETLAGRKGVCRDFAHLAIALCRCMNIPARYCTGYLSEFGEPEPHAPDDFAAWMEVWLDGRWWVFDPRNNSRRMGRILIARGRDAADVPLTQTFGPSTLTQFDVWTWDARHDPAETVPVSRN
ncbi:Transglutaminase-like enzyme, putative cysteine protease [Jannaschia seohaensis]|uniref:Transglutaminase-like enzyme, putative cysteine protease n=1 Tax=Jannaschia seohaensis TaxID=475081 RepID=A0A2Y9B599_9RHOB|nr:transglutaminase-like putative cysteine protease [Jannaschia seohaensis]SSA51560.1 Transglutaminase-like enzyme, putative cysteine protease [Jannaschia seohaensis]